MTDIWERLGLPPDAGVAEISSFMETHRMFFERYNEILVALVLRERLDEANNWTAKVSEAYINGYKAGTAVGERKCWEKMCRTCRYYNRNCTWPDLACVYYGASLESRTMPTYTTCPFLADQSATAAGEGEE